MAYRDSAPPSSGRMASHRNVMSPSVWWACEEGTDAHEKLVPLVRNLFAEQHARYEAYRRLAEVYGADMTARGGISTPFDKAFDPTLSMNELTNTIETLHSQVFKNRIIPAPVTEGGNFGAQSRAKQLGRWIEGVLDECEFHSEIVPRAGLHSLIWGDAFYRVGHRVVNPEKKLAKITIEVVDVSDIAVDPMDAMDGDPMSFFQVGKADRGKLIEKLCCVEDDSYYGTADQRREAILNGQSWETMALVEAKPGIIDIDKVFIGEAWRKPTESGKKGRYVLFTSAGTLIDREYEFQNFPHIKQVWMPSPMGYYGQSAVARLVPGQRAYDKLCERGDVVHDIMCIPRLIVSRGRGVKKEHIDDVEGGILEVDGDPSSAIREWNPTPIHPDFYRERDALPGKMRALLGVSEYSTNSQLPQQLREASGVALENWVDQESSKHAMAHRSYESAVCKLVYRIIDEACWLTDHGYDVQVKSVFRNVLEKIKFSDVKMDRDDFILKVLPVSHLSRTFTGKVNQLMPLLQNGAITMATFRRLTEVPDVAAENDLDTSSDEIIDQMLMKVFEDNTVYEITSFDNVDRIIQRGRDFVNYLRLKNVPADKLAPVVAYVEEAYRKQTERASAQASAQTAAAAGAMNPAGMAGPPAVPPAGASQTAPPIDLPPDTMNLPPGQGVPGGM